jgi:hypothetical protein
VRQLRESHGVPEITALLVALSLYSYHVRELLACWIFFSLLFVTVTLMILGGVLAWHAAKKASSWARTAGVAILLAKMKFRT